MSANLFLHHFSEPALTRMAGLIGGLTDCFVACEPRRSTLSLLGSRLVGVIGCNDVSRHDAVVSVRAGFHDGDLSAAWRAEPIGAWSLLERPAGLFTHTFTARRRREMST